LNIYFLFFSFDWGQYLFIILTVCLQDDAGLAIRAGIGSACVFGGAALA